MREAERLNIEGDSVGGDKNIYLLGGKEGQAAVVAGPADRADP